MTREDIAVMAGLSFDSFDIVSIVIIIEHDDIVFNKIFQLFLSSEI